MINVENLAKIVGSSNVSQESTTLSEYSRDMSFVDSIMPAGVVKPRNAIEIKRIVKLANKTLTPLIPVSSGPPHFRGDTVPGAGGSIILDLSRMKKIIRVDRINRIAICEPGVTFGELIAAVEKEGLRLNLPLLPRAEKSAVGSLLEREPVIMPSYQWDIADPLACVEIVFGTGDVFRTGSASGPGSLEEQWAAGGAQDEPLGPGPVSWHRAIQGAQGTLGIVTWASMRCELLPKLEEPFLMGSTQIEKLLEMVHWLVRLRLVNECFILNDSNLAAITAKKGLDRYHDIKETLPPWILFFNIAGYDYLPEERVSYQVRDMRDVARRLGMEPQKAIGRVSAGEILQAVHKPSMKPYWKLRYRGACQDIFFLTSYKKVNELIQFTLSKADSSGYPKTEVGVYLQPVVQGSSCHCEFNLFYDPGNGSESDRVKELSAILTKELMSRGAFFSRPCGENARMIINQDADTASALTKIKKIFDPNNIMNPGKLCF